MSSVTSPDQVALAERRLEEGQHHQRLRRLRDKERQRRHATLAIGAVAVSYTHLTLPTNA